MTLSSLHAFFGKPLQFSTDITIYPPTVNQVIETPLFDMYKRLLLIEQMDIDVSAMKDLNSREEEMQYFMTPIEGRMTPWKVLLSSVFKDTFTAKIVAEGLEFFTHKKSMVLPEAERILIGVSPEDLDKYKEVSEIPHIEEKDFPRFQDFLRAAVGYPPATPISDSTHPGVLRMHAKAYLRDQIKAKNSKGAPLEDIIESTPLMGLGIPVLNIGDLSLPTIHRLFLRYQMKEEYENDLKALFAGAENVKPQYWIRKLEN